MEEVSVEISEDCSSFFSISSNFLFCFCNVWIISCSISADSNFSISLSDNLAFSLKKVQSNLELTDLELTEKSRINGYFAADQLFT